MCCGLVYIAFGVLICLVSFVQHATVSDWTSPSKEDRQKLIILNLPPLPPLSSRKRRSGSIFFFFGFVAYGLHRLPWLVKGCSKGTELFGHWVSPAPFTHAARTIAFKMCCLSAFAPSPSFAFPLLSLFAPSEGLAVLGRSASAETI